MDFKVKKKKLKFMHRRKVKIYAHINYYLGYSNNYW